MEDSFVKIEFIRIRKEDTDLPTPAYATPGSSGMDVAAAVDGEAVIPPKGRMLVPTGLAAAVPSGYELQVRPRSGLAMKHGVTVLNSPGTIDSDYRGEIKVILVNLGQDDFRIKRGDRIAQLVVSRVYKADLVEVETLDVTRRGSGGFGHSGG